MVNPFGVNTNRLVESVCVEQWNPSRGDHLKNHSNTTEHFRNPVPPLGFAKRQV